MGINIACATDSMGTFVVWVFDLLEPGFTTSHSIIGAGEFVAIGMWCLGWKSI